MDIYMSKSIAKRFVTSSALILTMSSPIIATGGPIGTVLAEGESTTKTDSVGDKLTKAIDTRDLAHKEFVDATVDYTLAEKVLTSATESKDKADKSLSNVETIMSDAEKVISASNKTITDSNKTITEKSKVVKEAEDRIENVKNVKELATKKLEVAKTEKADADEKIKNAKSAIDKQNELIKSSEQAIKDADSSKDEPKADIKQFTKLLKAAQADLKEAKTPEDVQKAEGNVKTFETAIKQAQDKIDAADKTIKDSQTAIKNAKAEITKQNSIVTAQTKVSDAKQAIITAQEKAIADNNKLISEQNEIISNAKSEISKVQSAIDSATKAKTDAEEVIKENKPLVVTLKQNANVANKVHTEAKSTFDKAKNRLATAEASLKVAQSAVDALRAESVKDKVSDNVDNTKQEAKSDEVVKSARVDYVDENGKQIDSLKYELSNLEKLVSSAKTSGVKTDVTVKSILDSEKSKLEALIGDNKTLVLGSGRYSLIKVESTFENGDYVIKATVKTVDELKNTSEPRQLDRRLTPSVDANSSSTNTTTVTSNSNDTTTSVSNPTTSNSSSTSNSSTTNTPSTGTDTSTVESKGQTSSDGILTDMIFSKSGSTVSFKGMIDKSKLKNDQKLEGDFAKVVISKADGTELATLDVDNDYKFSGDLKSEPKDGEKLIIKYGGNIYEIDYSLDTSKKPVESNQSADKVSNSQGSQTQTARQNVKAGLLPSTGQQNLLGWTVAGIMMILGSVGAMFYKFKFKKDAEN
jgi:hypothetical protein